MSKIIKVLDLRFKAIESLMHPKYQQNMNGKVNQI